MNKKPNWKVKKTLRMSDIKIPVKSFGKTTLAQLNKIGKIITTNYLRLGRINEAIEYAKELEEAKKTYKRYIKRKTKQKKQQTKDITHLPLHYGAKNHKLKENTSAIKEKKNTQKTRKPHTKNTEKRQYTKRTTTQKPRTQKPRTQRKTYTKRVSTKPTSAKRKYNNKNRQQKAYKNMRNKVNKVTSNPEFISLHHEVTSGRNKFIQVRRIKKTKYQNKLKIRQFTPEEEKLLKKWTNKSDINRIKRYPKKPKIKETGGIDIVRKKPPQKTEDELLEELIMNDVNTGPVVEAMGGLENALEAYPEDIRRLLNDYLGLDWNDEDHTMDMNLDDEDENLYNYNPRREY